MGDAGSFPINILRFGPVYWIDAMEFDSIGYFETLENAINCASSEYEPFITALDENEEEEEEEEEEEAD